MLGYYKNEEATATTLDKEGWYHTGDLGTMDGDGNVFIKGRSKNMLLGASGQNKVNYEANTALYRRRQEINEHIFGTIKRQWNLYYTNLRGLEKVNGELSLIMLVYNMKRARNILGFHQLLEKLRQWRPKYPGGTIFVQNRLHICSFKHFYIFRPNICA